MGGVGGREEDNKGSGVKDEDSITKRLIVLGSFERAEDNKAEGWVLSLHV